MYKEKIAAGNDEQKNQLLIFLNDYLSISRRN